MNTMFDPGINILPDEVHLCDRECLSHDVSAFLCAIRKQTVKLKLDYLPQCFVLSTFDLINLQGNPGI